MKPLVILDINGFLCYKVSKNYEDPTDLQLKFYNIILRPNCKEFLSLCYEQYTIGFYSSTTHKNADPILKMLLTDEQDKTTIFKWFRDRTLLDPDWKKEITYDSSWDQDQFKDIKLKNYSTVKRLSSILDSPFINESRGYSFKNILICDDSAEKVRFNPKQNCLLVEPFTGDHTDNLLFTLIDEIDNRLSQL